LLWDVEHLPTPDLLFFETLWMNLFCMQSTQLLTKPQIQEKVISNVFKYLKKNDQPILVGLSPLSTSPLPPQQPQMKDPPNLTHPLPTLTHSHPKPTHLYNIGSMVKKLSLSCVKLNNIRPNLYIYIYHWKKLVSSSVKPDKHKAKPPPKNLLSPARARA
jgi:hypothetical protein